MAIAHVQSISTYSAGNLTLNGVGAGNLLIGFGSSNASLASLTCSGGGTWTGGPAFGTGSPYSRCNYCLSATGGNTTVSLTNNAGDFAWALFEFSGGTFSYDNNSFNVSTSANPSSPALTLSAGALSFGFLADMTGGSLPSAYGTHTVRQSQAGHLDCEATYVNAAGGSTTFSVTRNAGVAGIGQVSFTVAAAGFNPSVSDTASHTEASSAAVSDPQVNKSDTAAHTEAVSLLITSIANVSDTVGSSEAVGILEISAVNVSDTAAHTEAITAEVGVQVNVSDTIGTAESTSASMGGLPGLDVNVSDTVGSSEASTAAVNSQVNVTSAVSVADTPTVSLPDALAVNVSSAIGVSESTNLAVYSGNDLNVTTSEAVTVSELVGAAVSSPQVDVSDSTSLAESSGVTTVCIVGVSDAAAHTESVAIVNSDLSFTVSDTASVLDGSDVILLSAGTFYISLDELVRVGESLSAGWYQPGNPVLLDLRAVPASPPSSRRSTRFSLKR